jgi:hypothetical protein
LFFTIQPLSIISVTWWPSVCAKSFCSVLRPVTYVEVAI